jgi:hypothetical protein
LFSHFQKFHIFPKTSPDPNAPQTTVQHHKLLAHTFATMPATKTTKIAFFAIERESSPDLLTKKGEISELQCNQHDPNFLTYKTQKQLDKCDQNMEP